MDSNVSKIINRESLVNFPHGFLTKFPQRSLFYSQVSLLQKGLLQHYSWYFQRLLSDKNLSSNFYLQCILRLCYLSCSQKVTVNFWCVYFPSKSSTAQQINIHQVGCSFNHRISPTQTLIHISTCYNALSIQCQQIEAHYPRSFSVTGAEFNSSITNKAICVRIKDFVNSEVVQHVCTCSVRSLISRNVGNKIYRLYKHLYHTSVLDIDLFIPRELYSRVRY